MFLQFLIDMTHWISQSITNVIGFQIHMQYNIYFWAFYLITHRLSESFFLLQKQCFDQFVLILSKKTQHLFRTKFLTRDKPKLSKANVLKHPLDKKEAQTNIAIRLGDNIILQYRYSKLRSTT